MLLVIVEENEDYYNNKHFNSQIRLFNELV